MYIFKINKIANYDDAADELCSNDMLDPVIIYCLDVNDLLIITHLEKEKLFNFYQNQNLIYHARYDTHGKNKISLYEARLTFSKENVNLVKLLFGDFNFERNFAYRRTLNKEIAFEHKLKL